MRLSLLSFEIEIIFNLSFVVIDARVYEILLQKKIMVQSNVNQMTTWAQGQLNKDDQIKDKFSYWSLMLLYNMSNKQI
jgi:hypothetical protein